MSGETNFKNGKKSTGEEKSLGRKERKGEQNEDKLSQRRRGKAVLRRFSGKGSDAMRLGVSGQESYATTWTTSATSEGGETSPPGRHVFSFRLSGFADDPAWKQKRLCGQWRVPNAPHSLIKDRSRYEADNGAVIAVKNGASFCATRRSCRCSCDRCARDVSI